MSCFISYTSSFPTCWCQGKEQKSPEWTVRMTPMQCCQSFFIMFVCEVAHQYMKLTVLSVTITSSWVCSSLHCVEFFLLFHCRSPPGAIVHGLNPLDFWAHIYKSHKNKGYNPQNLLFSLLWKSSSTNQRFIPKSSVFTLHVSNTNHCYTPSNLLRWDRGLWVTHTFEKLHFIYTWLNNTEEYL